MGVQLVKKGSLGSGDCGSAAHNVGADEEAVDVTEEGSLWGLAVEEETAEGEWNVLLLCYRA